MGSDSSASDSEHKHHTKRSFWKEEEEQLLEEWADKAQCYQWMHLKSHQKYRTKNTWFTIPVIVLSTITGTANFAQDRFGEEHKDTVVMAIGTLNLLAGIITTVSQYLKIAELNEAHRVASLSWGKFYRNVKTELTKHPLDRLGPYEMLKMSKEEYDRLLEISPLIPKNITVQFKRAFKNVNDVVLPEIIETLRPTKAFELTKKERKKLEIAFLKQFGDSKKNDKIKALEDELKMGITTVVNKDKIKETKEITDRIRKFRNAFFQMNGRQPTQDEIQTKLGSIYEDSIGTSISNMFHDFKDKLFQSGSDSTDSQSNQSSSLNIPVSPSNIRIEMNNISEGDEPETPKDTESTV